MTDDDCYNYAMDGEPRFTLLARDPSAPGIVRTWANVRVSAIINGDKPESDLPKVKRAMAMAEEMERWRKENDGEWRKQGSLLDGNS